jgi:hypothetical protein
VGVEQTVTWLSYQDAAGSVIYGGTPLPPAPVGVTTGWVSPAFYYAPEPGRAAMLAGGVGLLSILGRRRGDSRKCLRSSGR